MYQVCYISGIRACEACGANMSQPTCSMFQSEACPCSMPNHGYCRSCAVSIASMVQP